MRCREDDARPCILSGPRLPREAVQPQCPLRIGHVSVGQLLQRFSVPLTTTRYHTSVASLTLTENLNSTVMATCLVCQRPSLSLRILLPTLLFSTGLAHAIIEYPRNQNIITSSIHLLPSDCHNEHSLVHQAHIKL